MKARATFAEDPTKFQTVETQIEYKSSILQNPSPNWSTTIRNLINQKKFVAAILVYTRNRGNGCTIILGAIPLVLKACASLSILELGKALHCDVIKSGAEGDVMLGTSLVDMYGKCRDILSARKVFDEMLVSNVISWNAMIGGYMRDGDTETALFLFNRMVDKTSVTWNEMIDGYARNGDMAKARQLFDIVPPSLKNVVSCTVMVNGYASHGDMEAAREVFEGMREKSFHVWSVMISGYFKKGDFVKAREIFDGMRLRNLVNWNSLISGYAQNGMCMEALDAFTRMQGDGFEPDEITMASILSACAQSGMLEVGKEIHEMILHKGIELNQFVLNGLVDMYARCGDSSYARLIFEGMPVKNCASWNTMISGLAIHGQCREAMEFFRTMEESGVNPDSVTLLSVLSACAHGGFIEEGLEAFSKITRYGLTPNAKHYGCLVDLLARAGKLREAFDLVKEMPMGPNDEVLGALLGACRTHGDTVMVNYLLELVRKMNSEHGSFDGAHYVLLSNIFAASERWEMSAGMRRAFSDTGFEKKPGCSALVL